MKTVILVLSILIFPGIINAQSPDSLPKNLYVNSAERLLATDGKFMIGGYGEIHYNQPLNATSFNNGKLDVHRMVMLLGYNFSRRVQFITEIEYEHVKEVFVEQAFLQFKVNNYLNVRAGLVLIPMGILNEYHEPTAFNGVERPFIDNIISPTTWREIGLGVNGNIIGVSLKYQAYIVNGFGSYNGKAMLNGSNGLRKGRQKGANSFINAPNFAGKIEYYGLRGLNIGLSGYFGKTQTTLYNGIDKSDKNAIRIADSSVVGVSMLGMDVRYNVKGFQFRGQFYYSSLANTFQYNLFTAESGDRPNDLGSAMMGYYVEAGYNVFRVIEGLKSALVPFVRYEEFNTHQAVTESLEKDPAYKQNVITAGLTWTVVKGAVVKTDVQFLRSGTENKFAKIFNAGIGVMF